MEPLHPELRADLKRAHPDLDDAAIDEYERLTAKRFTLDPDREKVLLAEIDAQRQRLLQAQMPHYAKVREAFLSRRRTAARHEEPPVKVEWRDDNSLDQTTGGGRRP